MSAALVLTAAAFGTLAGAVTARPAHRLAVAGGAPPRSACAACATPFPPGAAGWVRPRGSCPICRAPQRPHPWRTAVAGAVACGVLAWALDPGAATGRRATAAASLVLAAYLLTGVSGVLLGAIDLAVNRLPNMIVGAAFAGSLLLLGSAAAVAGTGTAANDLLRSLAAAPALSGSYLVLALLPGANLGLGDVKLCALSGLLLGWLGWDAVLLGGLLPHLINGPVALGLLLAGRAGRKTELPLGPALMVGALLAVVVHAAIRG